MTNAKNLTIGSTVSTIKIEHGENATAELKAIYCLLGGYNQVGRHIDVDKFHAIQARFKDAIHELKDLM